MPLCRYASLSKTITTSGSVNMLMIVETNTFPVASLSSDPNSFAMMTTVTMQVRSRVASLRFVAEFIPQSGAPQLAELAEPA